MGIIKNSFSQIFQTSLSSISSEDENSQQESVKDEPLNGMESLIHLMNDIQDILNELKLGDPIDLPQIVMLGSQSAGKSSVLETLVRRPFLPRGNDIVTRCPLVLQLIECKLDDTKYRRAANGTTEVKEWGEFLHLKDEIFTDFNEIRKEIEIRTDELTGKTKGISSEPINLAIYSPYFTTLTLVDLPGITKNAVGDQPKDIEKQIMQLVMKYIENPNSIILSVSTANTDIANSESLKYAKIVDPEGLRTLAILTKIDIMDKGTDAWKMLNGEVLPVKLGIIGVINRSQQDIFNNKTIEEQIQDEKAFFEKYYTSIAHRNGIPYLATRLSELLKDHIFKCLPDLCKKINDKLAEARKTLSATGESVDDPNLFLMRLTIKLSEDFTSIVNGSNVNDMQTLFGGPKFREIYDETFKDQLTRIEPNIDKDNIKDYIKSNGASRPPLCPSEKLFKKLVFAEIERLRPVSIKCVTNVYNEMTKVISHLIENQKSFQRFPLLKKKTKAVLDQFSEKQMQSAEASVDELIEFQKSCINTNHSVFLKEYPSPPQNDQQTPREIKVLKAEKIDLDAKIIEEWIIGYFPVVRDVVLDLVPKISEYKIINYMRENIADELMNSLTTDVNKLLNESEDNRRDRSYAQRMIEALTKAKAKIEQLEMDI